jgi:phenylacetic acid degradation operon negative regulatory protein
MQWKLFHHPDISLPVIRHKAGQELLTLLEGVGAMVLSRGASELYGACYPNQRAFKASLSRLRDKGLVVETKTDGTMPGLALTPQARCQMPDFYNPLPLWSKRWNQWWYVLMFDVPEKNRTYRDTLRKFLKAQRFGCLQRSVWVTPRDVRPEYDDLDRAAAVDTVAFLFEARTVLGHGNGSVVTEAWDFDRINRIQHLYLDFANENLALLNAANVTRTMLAELLRIENLAYAQSMSIDPLLPEELHPDEYVGMQVFQLHRKLIEGIVERMKAGPSRKLSRS